MSTTQTWCVIIFIIILLFVVLWALSGGKKREFVGLDPLALPEGQVVGQDVARGPVEGGQQHSDVENPPERAASRAEGQVRSSPIPHSYPSPPIVSPPVAPSFIDGDRQPPQRGVEDRSRDSNSIPTFPPSGLPPLAVPQGPALPHIPPFTIPDYIANPQRDEGKHDAGAPRMGGKKSLGEIETCASLERIFPGYRFQTYRPDFLRNPETGHAMEIDCYNPELRIGGEYSGMQHYIYPNRFNKSEEEFINQVRRDQLKVILCAQNDVGLAIVPYTVPIPEIQRYIENTLQQSINRAVSNLPR